MPYNEGLCASFRGVFTFSGKRQMAKKKSIFKLNTGMSRFSFYSNMDNGGGQD